MQEILGSLTSNKIINLQQNEDSATEYFLNDAEKVILGAMYKRTLLFNALMSCYTSVKTCVFKDGPSSKSPKTKYQWRREEYVGWGGGYFSDAWD